MKRSYSQIGQDIFTLNLFNNTSGIFLDLGSGDGRHLPCGNNTLLLEQNNWKGLCLDLNPSYIQNIKATRSCQALCYDLTVTDLEDILNSVNFSKTIDYLSFDVDGATDHVLNNFPFDSYKFNFITFEHDFYKPSRKELKERSKKTFLSNGYELLIENVIFDNHGAVEDWYINPNYNFTNKIYLKNINIRDILVEYNLV